jgi:hypothetical protein
MNRTTLKLIALCLSLMGPLVTFINRGEARDTRVQNRNGATPAVQAAPQEKTIGQTGKNIKVLGGMPQSQLYPAMRFMAASLGVQCGSCHVIRNGWIEASADDKPEKQAARQMIKMVAEMNKTYFQGNPTVSCNTCHRGHRSPQGGLVLPLPIPSRSSNGASTAGSTISSTSTSGLPSADDVLNKYLVAVGGKAATDMITSCVVKGSTTTAVGQVVGYEAEQSAPDKGRASEFPGVRKLTTAKFTL